MITRLGEILENPQLVAELINGGSTDAQSVIAAEIKKMLDTLPNADLGLKERTVFEKFARFKFREKFDAQVLESAPAMRKGLSMLENSLPDVVVRGHTQSRNNFSAFCQ